ncbi:MAG: Sua5/YciO/YrdC/YwlC translation factor [Bacteroidota bacterium]
MITKDLSIALKHLRQGDVIGMPTETVYGLAGNAFDANAIQKIYSIKQRPATNPLIVHVGSIQQAETFVKEFPEPLRQLAQAFWPGPLTLLLKKSDRIPDVVTAGSDRVAIRIPNHPLTIELLNQLDFPLVAPSANPYTRISPTNAQQVDQYFGDQIPVVLDGGACEKGLESTIAGWEDGQVIVYRLGSLSIEQLESVVGTVCIRNQGEKVLLAPGMTKKHYSPSTPFLIVENVVDYQAQHPEQHIGIFLAGNEDPDEIAPGFYARLQEMDKMGFDVLIASRLSDQGLGRTINDRLKRAGH